MEEYGGLTLDHAESLAYNDILEKLCPDQGAPTSRSRAANDHLLQVCVLRALDILEKQQGRSLDSRITEAVAELRTKLQSKPVRWQVWRKIDRLAVTDRGFEFGRVLFCQAGHPEILKAQATTAAIIASCPDPSRSGKQSDIWTEEFVKGTFCKIPVTAHDREAARDLADVELETTLAVLNFFGSLVLSRHLLPIVCAQGTVQTYTATDLVLEESVTGGYSNNRALRRFTTPFDIKKIHEDPRIQKAFQKASELLRGEGETDYRERVLTGLKWAGKGAVAESVENAFLFYAIALEGLILGGKRHDQLAYKLRLRIAHLLGLNPRARSSLRDRTRDIYDLRSKIAHAGKTEIPRSDLSFLQVITQSCVVHLLSDDKLSAIVTDSALEEWFEWRLMGDHESNEDILENQ